MKRLMLAALITAFAAGSAMAQSCETKAVSKEGKPLAGAAKTSFIKKCKGRRLHAESREQGWQAAYRRRQGILHEEVRSGVLT